MIVVALLLLVVAAAAVLFIAVTGSAEPVQLAWDAVNVSWAPTALAVFLLGAACLLVAQLGLSLLLRGNRKSAERRKELKHLRRVEAERARHGDAPTAPAAPAAAAAPAEPARSGAAPAQTPRPETGGRAGSSRS